MAEEVSIIPKDAWTEEPKAQQDAPPATPKAAESTNEQQQDDLWTRVYKQRQQFLEKHFGYYPEVIYKPRILAGRWPEGGLALINLKVPLANFCLATDGLSNPDMPTNVRLVGVAPMQTTEGVFEEVLQLEPKQPKNVDPSWAGYGFELMILSDLIQDWELDLLTRLVDEVFSDSYLILEEVLQKGFSLGSAPLSGNREGYYVITHAHTMPNEIALENGKCYLLVLTALTKDEYFYTEIKGLEALFGHLNSQGIGQKSIAGRITVEGVPPRKVLLANQQMRASVNELLNCVPPQWQQYPICFELQMQYHTQDLALKGYSPAFPGEIEFSQVFVEGVVHWLEIMNQDSEKKVIGGRCTITVAEDDTVDYQLDLQYSVETEAILVPEIETLVILDDDE